MIRSILRRVLIFTGVLGTGPIAEQRRVAKRREDNWGKPAPAQVGLPLPQHVGSQTWGAYGEGKVLSQRQKRQGRRRRHAAGDRFAFAGKR